MDKERIRQLAESAQRRGEEYHGYYEAAKASGAEHVRKGAINLAMIMSKKAAGYLNDSFYWFGHANAYKGILAGLEIQEGIDAERDAEGSCP